MDKTPLFQEFEGSSFMGNDNALYMEPIGFLGEVLPSPNAFEDKVYTLSADGKEWVEIPLKEVEKAYYEK